MVNTYEINEIFVNVTAPSRFYNNNKLFFKWCFEKKKPISSFDSRKRNRTVANTEMKYFPFETTFQWVCNNAFVAILGPQRV